MSDYGCECLFLATEDNEIYKLFKAKLGNKLLVKEQRRFNQYEIESVQYLSQVADVPAYERYLLGKNYLSTLNILSKCNYFVGGITSGTIILYAMNPQFRYDYLYNIGLYPPISKSRLRTHIGGMVRKILFKQ